MTVLRVCYKHGVRFDEAYYLTKHLPLAGSVMGPHGVTSVEMMKVTAAPGGVPPPYQVIFTAYFTSAAGLQNALQSPQMAQVLADVQNFYDGAPDILLGEVVPLK